MTRALLVGAAVWGATSVRFGTACGPCDLTASPLLNALSRWDGAWYVAIARDGYAYAPGVRSSVAFFPLFPLLMRLVAQVAGHVDDTTLVGAGVAVANASLVVALAYLADLGRLEGGAAAGRRAALYLLVFPTTIFLSAAYPTSLFLALAVGALVEMRRGRWTLAGVLAALAALTRPFGVALALPLGLQAIAERGRPGGARRWTASLLPVLAFAGWQAYLYRIFGDPLIFIHAQQAYGRHPSLPFAELADLFDPRVYSFPWIVVGVLALATVLVVSSWRLATPPTAAIGTALYALALSSGTVTSFPRYALEVFPLFVVLGIFGARRPVNVAYVAVAAVCALVLAAMFGSWYWIG